MRGAYIQLLKQMGDGVPQSRVATAVEKAKALHKEACELRLARIMNGKEPGYENGHPKKRA